MKLEHRLRAKLTHSTSSKPEPCLEPVFTSKPFKKSPYTVTHKPPTKIHRDTYDAISPPITHQQSLYSLLLLWLVKKAQLHLAPDPNESFVLVSLTGRIFSLLFGLTLSQKAWWLTMSACHDVETQRKDVYLCENDWAPSSQPAPTWKVWLTSHHCHHLLQHHTVDVHWALLSMPQNMS